MVYVPTQFHIDPHAEKTVYDLHDNSDTNGYRKFLNRTAVPILDRLTPNSIGLDFGCGPNPVLAKIFTEHGHRMAVYDKFYATSAAPLLQKYDFITMTEVIEHIAKPIPVLETLFSCLNDDGILAVMTKRLTNQSAFKTWHYKNDPTHITFYSEKTFQWISAIYDLKIEIIDQDVVFLSKVSRI
ncbi:class I SAM-dependent methyltransferase [Temperatibacter marinus]|uniref:Class I SAM-dependent methyltransferase n=1 Tax=Temperatibacter marinus TaxID=1456591 RepID=A0AA52H830_9PROT|nr:class I SAM-dependent methyltransferase [Temperatibacter marinus]WND01404.1 class I SAM-dependent methyltransferase [Temperatibacter marinus]